MRVCGLGVVESGLGWRVRCGSAGVARVLVLLRAFYPKKRALSHRNSRVQNSLALKAVQNRTCILPPSSERLSIAISQKRLGEHLVLRPESCSVTKFGSRTVCLRLCEQKKLPAAHVSYFLPLSRAAGRDGATRRDHPSRGHGSSPAALNQTSRCMADSRDSIVPGQFSFSPVLMLSYQPCRRLNV